jgi:hypothetical protein
LRKITDKVSNDKQPWSHLQAALETLEMRPSKRQVITGGEGIGVGTSSTGGKDAVGIVSADTWKQPTEVALIVQALTNLPGFDKDFLFTSLAIL